MDTIERARALTLRRLAEAFSAATIATVVVYLAVIASSPAVLQLTPFRA